MQLQQAKECNKQIANKSRGIREERGYGKLQHAKNMKITGKANVFSLTKTSGVEPCR